MYTKLADVVFGLFATVGGVCVCVYLFTQEIINFCSVPLNMLCLKGV